MSKLSSWRHLLIGAAALTGLLFTGAGTVTAQSATPAVAAGSLSIIVVDVSALMRDSKAAKSIAQQMEQFHNGFTKDLQKQEGDLRAAKEEIDRQRTILAPDVLNERVKDFQQKYVELERNSQAKRDVLARTNQTAMKQVVDKMLLIVSDIATERKANIVLPKSEVVLVDKGLDVTDETMKRLDQALPAVTVKLEAAAPMAANQPSSSAPAAPAQAASKKNSSSSKKQ
ncbi:MAG TPA: OmpH family outer membrane protein [Stellaceae bacterium]|jgi:Skp family chaperone for outer membrane proteins